MDHADDGDDDDDDDDDDDVFVYMGGDQEVPGDVTHVRIHKSVKIIRRQAFQGCRNLVSVEMHDGVEIIEEDAFRLCLSLRRIKLPGVKVVGGSVFQYCQALEDVEFGDKLDTIGDSAFVGTPLMRSIKIPKVRVIGERAFFLCLKLTDVELSKDLERMGCGAFRGCPLLRRIAFPLKDNMLDDDVFLDCDDLLQVELVGGIHKTISSLLLDSWRNEMKDEIDRINQLLPSTNRNEKTAAIQQWMERVLRRIEHCKSEHYTLLKEDMTQLELALWGANLPNVDAALASRHEARVTCGANIIIPHVLSFLNDADEFPLREYNL